MSSLEKEKTSDIVSTEDDFDTPEDRALLRKVDLRSVPSGLNMTHCIVAKYDRLTKFTSYPYFALPAIFP